MTHPGRVSFDSRPPTGMESQDSSPVSLAQRIAQARHDLRNPLSGILGFSEMLLEEASEQGHDSLGLDFERIHHAAADLLKRLTDHLDAKTVFADPQRLEELHQAIGGFSPRIVQLAGELAEQCEGLHIKTLGDDLKRISDAARQLCLLADSLLPGLLQGAEVGVVQRGPGFGGPEVSTGLSESARASLFDPDGGTILIVDDNEANRILLSRTLRRLGQGVTTAKEGREALQLLSTSQFDVVLLDIVMPELDGHQVLRQMKQIESLRHIPVIMISALDDLDNLVRCIEEGADDYLTKPFDPVLLRARIGACLEKKRLRDQEQALLKQLQAEQEKSERLLLNVLPKPIADRLKQGEVTIVDSFAEVSVLFADLVGFTSLFTQMSPAAVVNLLNEIFSAFDLLAENRGLEKIKTIGDAYMVVGGLPMPLETHAEAIAGLALDMQREIKKFNEKYHTGIKIRIGIDTGPCIAGIIGRNKFTYDLWGDSVNTASRMESQGQADCIQVTAATYDRLKGFYEFQARGVIDIKGKGQMPVYLLTGRKTHVTNSV